MESDAVRRTCGVLGLLVILLGVTLGYLGVPLIDWVALAVGTFLLTYAIFTGDRVLLFDRIRRTR